jgi:hypothetical protein
VRVQQGEHHLAPSGMQGYALQGLIFQCLHLVTTTLVQSSGAEVRGAPILCARAMGEMAMFPPRALLQVRPTRALLAGPLARPRGEEDGFRAKRLRTRVLLSFSACKNAQSSRARGARGG